MARAIQSWRWASAAIPALALACFSGAALRGEPCVASDECGPSLGCEGGFCGGPRQTFACGDGVTVAIDNLHPNIVLVLDRSGSMIGELGETTRWEILRGLVGEIVETFGPSMNLGAVRFPSLDAEAKWGQLGCVSNTEPDVPLALANQAAILAAIPSAEELPPEGATPTTAAVRVALEHLRARDRQLTKALVLITDGAANCGDASTSEYQLAEGYDDALPVTVAEAAAAGIPTYVVGIAIEDSLSPVFLDGQPDNINTFEVLSELAVAGGTAREGAVRFYEAGDLDELLAELAELPEAVLDCTIPLDPRPDYPELIEVAIDGKTYERRQGTACEGDGYRFTGEALDTIELCEGACARFQASGALSIGYRCPDLGD
ncbi:MAG: VWA domain-containing protein [Myxococcales bacterium]|nr:VWA domain-containing protein [Myxococcales bacterium]